MKNIAWLALLIPPFAIAQGGFDNDARVVMLEDPVRIVFQRGVMAPTAERLRTVVPIAAGAREWRVLSDKDGTWELMREVRGTHMIRVGVSCGETDCAIRYLSSINLLYRERPIAGTTVRTIHRNYNTWVHELATTLAGGLGVPAQVSSGFAPVTAIEAVPFIGEAGRQAYQKFLGMATPRAFAIAPNGAWGRSEVSTPVSVTRSSSADSPTAALAACNQSGAGQCRLYAVDDQVIWRAP